MDGGVRVRGRFLQPWRLELDGLRQVHGLRVGGAGHEDAKEGGLAGSVGAGDGVDAREELRVVNTDQCSPARVQQVPNSHAPLRLLLRRRRPGPIGKRTRQQPPLPAPLPQIRQFSQFPNLGRQRRQFALRPAPHQQQIHRVLYRATEHEYLGASDPSRRYQSRQGAIDQGREHEIPLKPAVEPPRALEKLGSDALVLDLFGQVLPSSCREFGGRGSRSVEQLGVLDVEGFDASPRLLDVAGLLVKAFHGVGERGDQARLDQVGKEYEGKDLDQ
mmetsp:Transcript_3520/g.7589  ORF Transcript_3520/g.7589 Transcript_3520/m.7589 type:complete len:274 (-) Transcript_3520:903-1724(-)